MDFAWDILDMMLKGQSGLDLRSVPFKTRLDAERFLLNYGFNWQDEADQMEMNLVQAAAFSLIEKRFLVSHASWDHFWGRDEFQIPRDFKYLELPDLMLKSSVHHPDHWEQVWACALLKVMHLICHVQNSFYAHYLAEAREQIQARFDACLFNDLKTNKLCIGKPDDLYLPIVDFQIKDSKSLDSAIIKLICKKESIAEQVLDLFGVRIITEKPADAILALEIIRRNRIVIFANLIPSRSHNTLVNLHDFTQLEQEIQQRVPGQTEGHKAMDIIELFRKAPASAIETSFKKHNAASHDKYRAIHLTPRQLIRCKGLDHGGESRIFFPYEIQITDKASDQQNKSGDSAHARYKRKQLIQARRRILAPLLGLHRQQRENAASVT